MWLVKKKRLHPLYVNLLRMLNPNHNGVSDIGRILKVLILNLKAVTHSHNHQRAEEEELSCLPRGKLIEWMLCVLDWHSGKRHWVQWLAGLTRHDSTLLLLLPISDHLHPILSLLNRCAPRKRFVNLGPGGLEARSRSQFIGNLPPISVFATDLRRYAVWRRRQSLPFDNVFRRLNEARSIDYNIWLIKSHFYTIESDTVIVNVILI